MDSALPLHLAARTRSLRGRVSDNGAALLAARARRVERAGLARPRALRLEPHNLLRPRADTLCAPRPLPPKPRNRAGGRAPSLVASPAHGHASAQTPALARAILSDRPNLQHLLAPQSERLPAQLRARGRDG